MSKASRHMGRVAALGCILCRIQGRGQVDAEIHHLREGVGMSQRQSDYLTVPLCPACHRGSTGLHGDRSLLRISKLDELGLLAATLEELES